jgi:hypothetical protein
MVPLMAQEKYRANGWLGLLLGTELWFPIYGLENADDKTFEAKVDPIVKVIGDRGKAKADSLPEGVPRQITRGATRDLAPAKATFEPTREPEPVPARSSLSAVTPTTPNRTALATVAPATQRFTPTLQMSPGDSPTQLIEDHTREQQHHINAMNGVSLSEIAAIFREQRDEAKADRLAMEARMDQQLAEAKAERAALQAEMEVKFEQQRAGSMPQQAITEAQLVALQTRLEGLHSAELLSDSELYETEDILADWVEVQASMVNQIVTEAMLYASAGDTFVVGATVHKLIRLSTVTPGDAALARQVRRKFLSGGHKA